MARSSSAELSPELRSLVRESVRVLGEIIRDELGVRAYRRIESVRARMAGLRGSKNDRVRKELARTYRELERLSRRERGDFAQAYTLMLELMNACENAYRTHRLKHRRYDPLPHEQRSIFYVLTAHPTESRSPENIAVFQSIQRLLETLLVRGFDSGETELKALLRLAWRIPIVRTRKPRVQDEAEHIYSILLKEENLSTLFDVARRIDRPVYIRSWVGGDKDGHPGVDQNALSKSLSLSRKLLLKYVRTQAAELRAHTELLPRRRTAGSLKSKFLSLDKAIRQVAILKPGDAARIHVLKEAITRLEKDFIREIGDPPAPLVRLTQVCKFFPGFVVPLELREDSGVILSDPTGDSLAIGRMLKRIGDYSRGHDPCWYARGMIISMAESYEQIRAVYRMIRRQVGNDRIPVVPLFEKRSALEQGPEIIRRTLADPAIRKSMRVRWQNKMEIMLGYSDSAKESGVLPSRFLVSKAMREIDRVCAKAKAIPVFFHGSGGSIDRGGGPIADQMAGWPESALRIYKATLQGEMIERTFSSPEIIESQIRKIAELSSRSRLGSLPASPALKAFAARVSSEYRRMIRAPSFLEVVEKATPYPFLSALKMGSRPTKRTGTLSVGSLRAIPWILCWTQTRILFPTWWGVGTAWRETPDAERRRIRREFGRNPIFRSFIHALGFTLAKVEIAVWETYLERSALDPGRIAEFTLQFRRELTATHEFLRSVTGKRDPLWYRPWLGRSIELRASMIHPLNLLEIIAQKTGDISLLRVSVTGIASGMLTTG